MQRDPRYFEVAAEVERALAAGLERLLAAGVPRAAVLVDPGIGFGKTLAHNLVLLQNLHRLTALGPVVVGVSRKSMLDQILGGRPPAQRVDAGLGAAVWSALHGASLIRTHDVLPTVDALRVVAAIARGEEAPRVD
jgi:dihydropteroate synthase